MSELRIANAVRLTSIKAMSRDAEGRLRSEITYKAPKGEDFIVLLLGTAKHADPFKPDAMLTELGWTFEDASGRR